MKRILIIETFEDGTLRDHFEFPFDDVPGKVTLPEGDPYQGHSFLITTDGKGGYEFTPDASEMWVRFGDEKEAKLTEYFGYKPFVLTLKTRLA